jgi:hypothetical protein
MAFRPQSGRRLVATQYQTSRKTTLAGGATVLTPEAARRQTVA